MTIRFQIGLQRSHTVPIVTRKANWTYGLADKSVSVTQFVDLNELNLCYTSLRDLITPNGSKRGSPKTGKAEWCDDLSHFTFKDRLVKQAARAYLQPMIHESHHEHLLLRYWRKFRSERSFISGVGNYLHAPAQACIRFATHAYLELSKAVEIFAESVRRQLFWFLHVRDSGIKLAC